MKLEYVNIFVANHYENGVVLQDFIDLIRYELDDLNIPCVVTQNLMTDAVNIIFEDFSFPALIQKLYEQFQPNDPRLVVVATEVIRDGVFNSMGSIDQDMQSGHYQSGSEMWLKRTNSFNMVAKLFSTVLCPAEQIYSSHLSCFPEYADRVRYWPIRYKKQIANRAISWPKATRKIVDFSFTGSLTPYREACLDKIRGLGYSVDIKVGHSAEFLRMSCAQQSHFLLALKHYPNTDLLSKMRVWWALNNHFPMLVESYPEQTDFDEFLITFNDLNDLIEVAHGFSQVTLDENIDRYSKWSNKQDNPLRFLENSMR